MTGVRARPWSGFVVALALAGALIAGCGGSSDEPAGTGGPQPPGSTGTLPADDLVRYVAPAGDDGDRGTGSAPFATITRGLQAMQPGGTLVLRGGTYREDVVATQAGTAERPITVRAAPGERPVIRSAGVDETLEIGTGAAYLRFDGIVIEGARGESTANVYASGDAHDIELRACEVRGSERQGFFSERTTRAIRVDACFFHDNGGSGPDNQDHNLYVEGEDHEIVNSVIVRARNGWGIQLYPVTRNVVVANNTIVRNRSGIIVGADASGQSSGNVIVNNIIAYNRETGLSTYWGDGTPGTRNVARSNLLFRNGDGNIDRSGGGMAFRANTVADPKFANLAKGDLRPGVGSAADGRAVGSYAPDTDFLGRQRGGAGPPDLGAIENGSGP